ncbi:GNAT family N-acetyltransferase [Aeromicrobium endophyticum]|uniref:N-acetyltransferase n=1 Tax=Aeromicrobium endophyticum TaxID=2292704 RepID=A0A371P2N4_9ACTN|nr:GNAT family N-acetyltransferase [Aeromicrobium endophyticum]REK70213.1 N-acetyltransferase [Aeromicrobium endophyticum]
MTRAAVGAPAGYELVPDLPDVAEYRRLRERSGLSPKDDAQARGAVTGSWAGCHVVHARTSSVVAMGRVIGDGGWYFHLADIATDPDHQGLGLGSCVMRHLLGVTDQRSPAHPYVILLADPPGRRLYERFGFRESAPRSVGMVRTVVTP